MRKLGKIQAEVLRCLREHGRSGGWIWDTERNTNRILDKLVERGLATKDESGQYWPTKK